MHFQFPEDFAFGVCTSAYQTEGAWNKDGKGLSIWDTGCQTHPEKVYGRANGNFGTNFYSKFKDDIQLMKSLNINFHHFSIAWTRIQPTGKDKVPNQDGINFYNKVINELLANGIEPYVTMYHWDLPDLLQVEGEGWFNKKTADYFVAYAKILFENFGDRVKTWVTFWDPLQFCEAGYSEGIKPPFINKQGLGGYLSAHNVLLAHSKVYKLYKSNYKAKQNGRIGIAVSGFWVEPNNEQMVADRQASETSLQMTLGWFLNPLFFGNYPAIMMERVRGLNDGIRRLPIFTPAEIKQLKGSLDFIGLIHFTTNVCLTDRAADHPKPSHKNDIGVTFGQRPEWKVSAIKWLAMVPYGLRKLLKWIRYTYVNPPVLICANGYPDMGGLDDRDRIDYIRLYLYEILRSIYEEECHVLGYSVYTFIDCFEWGEGYTQPTLHNHSFYASRQKSLRASLETKTFSRKRYGIVQVNFKDPNRVRTPKSSYFVYKKIIQMRKIDWLYVPIYEYEEDW